MSTLTLKNVKKIYDNGAEAVHSFNLDVADREFIVLVGPSGCGKSTLLKMIAGIEEISEGDFLIDDKLMNNVEPKDRDIAMVFQSYALYPHMTVYDNMAFALKLRHAPKEEIDRRVKWAADILGISEYLKRKPKALSGGQRQRVAIGRAIVREPKLFLMDEPLSNLDAKLRNQMRAEILKLRQSVDTTFVYVTHDQVEAMTLGDRIVIMRDGWVMQVGTPQELFDQPANIFVAGFIGMPQMNFFDAELYKQGESYSLVINGANVRISERIQQGLREKDVPEGKVIVGCRPEHMLTKDMADDTTMTAEIDVSEMMGSEIHIHLNCAGRDVVVRVSTVALTPDKRAGIAHGNKINIAFPDDLIHIFDAVTERNLLDAPGANLDVPDEESGLSIEEE